MKATRITLVTLIGRGRKDEGGQIYQKVAYAFGSEAHESVFFVDAVLASRHGEDADEVVICGTRTSSWGALVEHLAAGEDNLYYDLETATEVQAGQPAAGVSDTLLARLAAVMSQVWGRRVRCLAVAHESIDDDNVAAVVDLFLGVFPWQDQSRRLLLDTTHAFRTLSLAASVAVDLGDALAPGFARRTELVYGELKGKAGRGVVFRTVTTIASIGDAIRRFVDTFDADALAPFLKPHAPRLSDALADFSGVVTTNSLRRLDETSRRMLNAIEREPVAADAPGWVQGVHQEVEAIARRLGRAAGPRQLVALAELRAERGHTALAILALWEALTWFACGDRVGTHDELKDELDRLRDTMRRKGQLGPYDEFRRLRNQVAHGASVAEDSGRRNAEAMRRGYDDAHPLVLRLLNDTLSN